MEKTVVTISIWQKTCVHIISWHRFLIAVTLMCWEACPDCPFTHTDGALCKHPCCSLHCHLEADTQLFSFILLHASCLTLHRQELANYVWAGSCSIIRTTCLALHPAIWYSPWTLLQTWKAHKCPEWQFALTSKVVPTQVKPPGVYFVIELLY